MSMISMQVDRLRDRAMRVEIFLEGSTDAIPTDTHIQLRDAADTIWELRNKMCGMVDARERARVLEADNAKLRELAAESIRLMQADGPDCGLCKHYDECWTGEAMNYSPSGCVICNEARELGIEVNE